MTRTVPEGRISQVIVKLAERCNLDCPYCYMYHGADQSWRTRPKFMPDAVFDAMLDRLLAYCERRGGHKVGLSLHGGEPLLVRRERFQSLVERARERLGDHLSSIAVQTNGVLLDDAWALHLARLQVSVGISIDGPAEVHDAARPDLRGRPTHARVVEAIVRLRAAGLDPLGLCVIDPRADGGEVYDHLRALGLRKIDLLIPDVTHETVGRVRGEAATPIADYLIAAAGRWLAEDDPEVEVRILHGLFRKLMGGPLVTDAFGNPRLSYLVVDTDGTVQGNDVLKICRPALPETGLNVLEHDLDLLTAASGPVGAMVHKGVPLCATCRACPDVEVCGGGYLPHRWSDERGFDNPSAWCGDIRKLLADLRGRCGVALAS